MIQLTRRGVIGEPEISGLRREFEGRHTFRIPQLLDDGLLAFVSDRLRHAKWNQSEYKKIGSEQTLDDPLILNALTFVINTPRFLDLIRGITGCDTINNFGGRVYRMSPHTTLPGTAPAAFHWHDDASDKKRLVGMSVNLSEESYEGGTFRLRKADSHELLGDMPNLTFGGAIFFRIRPDLEHMVSAIEGIAPKTAFAGWFSAVNWTHRGAIQNLPAEESLQTA
jgi:hypothetical protein